MANADVEEDAGGDSEAKNADEETGPKKVTTDSVANNHLVPLRGLLTNAENAARKNEAMDGIPRASTRRVPWSDLI